MVPFCLCEALNVIKNNINNFPVGCSGRLFMCLRGGDGGWGVENKP